MGELRKRVGGRVHHEGLGDFDDFVISRHAKKDRWDDSEFESTPEEQEGLLEETRSESPKRVVQVRPTQNQVTSWNGSNALEIVRRIFDFMHVYLKGILPSFAQLLSFFLPSKIDERTTLRLREFRDFALIPYNKEDPDHEAKLLMLWSCSFPQEELDDRISKNWGKLGFQGKDPATDLRGWGLFGLKSILYFAHHYPESFQYLVAGQHHKEAYPFAITSFNLTDMLFEILGVGLKPNTTSPAKVPFAKLLFSSPQSNKQSGSEGNDSSVAEATKVGFQEVFCAAFLVFDQTWLKMNGKYLEFPTILAATKKRLERLIIDEFSSVEKVKQWNSMQKKD